MKSSDTGLKRIVKAFGYSCSGLKAAFQSESAFRQDVIFCLGCGFGLFFLSVRGGELALMITTLVFILWAELVNTAIESVIDRIGQEYHPLSRKAKDIGSALVLISFVLFFIVWACILIPIYD